MSDKEIPDRRSAFDTAVDITKEAKRGGDGRNAAEMLRETYEEILKIYKESLDSESS